MSKKILIVDDDATFVSLLEDIFEQADYEVVTQTEPTQALERFRNEAYDLVVLDHRMPDMTGTQLLEKLQEANRRVPVIVCSGYLDNDMIRDLIRVGVGGVFSKPLNVFSLLQRANELIEEAHAQDDEEEDTGPTRRLDFAFESFPAQADASVDFAKRLRNFAGFKSVMLLIGEVGTRFDAICRDLERLSAGADQAFLHLPRADIQEEWILSEVQRLEGLAKRRVTLCVLDADRLDAAQQQVVQQFNKKQGAFSSIRAVPRLVLCVGKDMETLYEDGSIGEELYMMMMVGVNEVLVPALRDCPEDIPFLANEILSSYAQERGLSKTPALDRSARTFVQQERWPGNYQQLRRTLISAVAALGAAGGNLSAEDIRNALQGAVDGSGPGSVDELKIRLKALRDDYIRAVYLLCGGSQETTSQVLDVDPALVSALGPRGDK